MSLHVFEIQTAERTIRNYTVVVNDDKIKHMDPEIDGIDDELLKAEAEMMVREGEVPKFTEGDAEIEEVLEVRERRD